MNPIILPDYVTKEWCAEHTLRELSEIVSGNLNSILIKLSRKGWKLKKIRKTELPDWFTEEYINAHSSKEISDRLGCSDSYVRQICSGKKWKIKRKNCKSKLDNIPKEELEEMTQKEIMLKYKVGSKTVWRFLKKNNITVKPKIFKKDRKNVWVNNYAIRIASNELNFSGMINVRPKRSYYR